jgi:hypothetical protein
MRPKRRLRYAFGRELALSGTVCEPVTSSSPPRSAAVGDTMMNVCASIACTASAPSVPF